MRWDDLDEICEALAEIERPFDLRGMTTEEIVDLVTALPSFSDERTNFHAGHIEAIRGHMWWGLNPKAVP